MARWDDEQFHSLVPPKDIMCASCKYKAPPVTVGDYTQDRSGYSMSGWKTVTFKIKVK